MHLLMVLDGLVRWYSVALPVVHDQFSRPEAHACKCQTLLPALQSFWAFSGGVGNKTVLTSFGRALQHGGITSRVEAKRCGFEISRKAWRDSRGDALVKKVRQPLKIDI